MNVVNAVMQERHARMFLSGIHLSNGFPIKTSGMTEWTRSVWLKVSSLRNSVVNKKVIKNV